MYLSHSFVESTDMKNIYDDVVIMDKKGKAEVNLLEWLGALNKDFRYQLTPRYLRLYSRSKLKAFAFSISSVVYILPMP